MNLLLRNRQEEEPKKNKGTFRKGHDPRRNLSGRPKLGNTLAARYRDALSEAESDARGGDYTKLDAMIDILIEKAMKGDQRAIEYLQERGFGKVPDRISVSQEEPIENPYNLKLLDDDELDHFHYLIAKASGAMEHLADKEAHDWDGGKKRYFRMKLVKEYIDAPQLPGVVDAEATDVLQ